MARDFLTYISVATLNRGARALFFSLKFDGRLSMGPVHWLRLCISNITSTWAFNDDEPNTRTSWIRNESKMNLFCWFVVFLSPEINARLLLGFVSIEFSIFDESHWFASSEANCEKGNFWKSSHRSIRRNCVNGKFVEEVAVDADASMVTCSPRGHAVHS